MNSSQYYIYAASGEDGGGICLYTMNSHQSINMVAFYPLGKTMYLTRKGNKLYAISAINSKNEGGLTCFTIQQDGTLIRQSKTIPTHGKEVCHISVHKNQIYCTNYDSGSVILMPDKLVTHLGNSVDPVRQASAHTHFVGITPDQTYVCVVDLGLDKIITYDLNLNYIAEVQTPAGAGPRHLVFSQDGKSAFCANELSSSLSIFSYSDGVFTLQETMPCLPPDESCKENFPAAIRLSDDGKFLFVSNRGDNSITTFAVKENYVVEPFRVTPCGGDWPRDFYMVKNLLVCANERSNSLSLFEKHGGILTLINKDISVPTPLSVLICQDTDIDGHH